VDSPSHEVDEPDTDSTEVEKDPLEQALPFPRSASPANQPAIRTAEIAAGLVAVCPTGPNERSPPWRGDAHEGRARPTPRLEAPPLLSQAVGASTDPLESRGSAGRVGGERAFHGTTTTALGRRCALRLHESHALALADRPSRAPV
jgi:hypothetical protein